MATRSDYNAAWEGFKFNLVKLNTDFPVSMKKKMLAPTPPEKSTSLLAEDSESEARPRVLQASLLCDPVSSMEARLGWHRAVVAAQHFNTTVFCAEMCRAAIMDHYAAHGQVPGLSFRFLPFSPKHLNNGSIQNYRSFYHDYHTWQRNLFEIAAKLHRKRPYCLAHQIGICGFREPGYLWQLGIPFLWGPFGGTQNFPPSFLSLLSRKDAALEVARTLMNECHLRFRVRVRKAVRSAEKIYAANTQNQLDFLRVHGRKPDLQLETGLPDFPDVSLSERSKTEPFKILWSGRLKPWKGLPILLHALEGLDKEIEFELRIIGHEADGNELPNLATKLGLDARTTWLGWPEYQESLKEYAWANVFSFTSLRDTSGTGLLEALSYGCPIIGLDHQGAGDIMTEDCAVPIKVDSPKAAIAATRQAILDLANNPGLLLRKSQGALRRASDFSWEVLGKKMVDDYKTVIERNANTK